MYSDSNLDWVVGQSVLCLLSGCILPLIFTGLLISLCYVVCLVYPTLSFVLFHWELCFGSDLDWVVGQSVFCRLSGCILALILTGLLVSLCYVVCLVVF